MKTLRKYLITLTLGALAVLGLAWAKDIFSQTETAEICHILCDVIFAVGTVMTSAGLLIFTANEGTFDMLAYGMSSFLDLFRATSKKKYATFYDYKESRADKKIGFGFLLVCGLIFVAISLALLPFCG